MKLADYKNIFIAVGVIGVLLISLPAIESVVQLPANGEAFSELYLLGPGRTAEGYPSNIVPGQIYFVYLGVGNHLGQLSYYTVSVKLLNVADPLPNSTSGTPSLVSPLYEYKVIVPDNETVESLFTFSFGSLTYTSNQTAVLGGLTINGVQIQANKPATLDPTTGRYRYNLVFELWLYDSKTNSIQYNQRFVDLNLECPSANS